MDKEIKAAINKVFTSIPVNYAKPKKTYDQIIPPVALLHLYYNG
jgi:hypothetical protein